MRKIILKKEDLRENTFWHITSKLNIDSIATYGLVPRDGKRNGEIESEEDPVPRVFFSQELEGILGQANNLAYLINSFIKGIARISNGDNGKDIKENLTEQDLNTVTYNIVKTIWENEICLKANLEEGIDYSWEDFNYNLKGTKKVPMTKRNMHAFEGRTITSDKIKIITDENGQPRTTWDIFKEMAIFYKKEHPEKEYLPVEEWQSAFLDEKGQTVYTGETNHNEDYVSMFIEMENNKSKDRPTITPQKIVTDTVDIGLQELNGSV